MLAIKVDDLYKSYGDVQALNGISMEIDEGEFFGLLGPNGAGKTTFINILVGLAKKDSGCVEVFGYDIEKDYKKVRDIIGLAPQEFNVDRFFPIEEVLAHKAGYHGVPKKQAMVKARDILKTVGIYDKRKTSFHHLSGGMKRRLILARALVTDPDLLILDEPTAGVDVELRHDLWSLVRKMNDEGITVLLTTHYIEEAERLCDRVAIMDEGNILNIATPKELKNRGSDIIRVRLDRHLEYDPSILFDGEIEETYTEGDEVVVKTKKGGSITPSILRKLEEKGYNVIDIEVNRASLEEVFVEMTRKKTKNQ